MLSEGIMKKTIILVILTFIANLYAADNESEQEKESLSEPKQSQEQMVDNPIEEFIPSEKLRADDVVAFPVDI